VNNLIIEGITQIANHERIKKIIEPNIKNSLPIEIWMTKRILYAWLLFENEVENNVTKH